MNIVVLGPPGSGKGSQSNFLADKFQMEHIDMGRFLRVAAEMETPLGKEIKEIIFVKKTLVPDHILREVLHLKLSSVLRERGLAFDGVPRAFDQMVYIDEALLEFGRKMDKVFYLKVSKEEVINRIIKRWVCKSCKEVLIMGKDVQTENDSCPKCQGKIIKRADDTLEGIEKRWGVFQNETIPVIEEYRKRGILVEINGEQAKQEVFAEILNKI
jgi:adenylate kinase